MDVVNVRRIAEIRYENGILEMRNYIIRIKGQHPAWFY
jgi:hypothetical protein